MGDNFYDAENRAEAALKRKKNNEEMEMLEETIRSLIEDPSQEGLTDEQMFLIAYYGLDENEMKQKNFNLSNIEQMIYKETDIPREQLETNRYEALIDLYSVIEKFDGKEINQFQDRFHSPIKEWDDYTRDFDQEPLMIKKMRNLQMLNQMAHRYRAIFRGIVYRGFPELNLAYTEVDKKNTLYNIEELFSSIESDAQKAERRLIRKFGTKRMTQWKNNKAIKYCCSAEKWMFEQKNIYLTEILGELQNVDGEYNYGVNKSGFIFDVPGYGQFGVHLGNVGMKTIQTLKEIYQVKDYEGNLLGNVRILSKADPVLLENVNYEELSDLDKQRYQIACQKPKEKPKEQNTLEELVESAKDKQKALKIIQVLEEANLEPEKLVTKTVLDKGEPDAIRDIIEIIGHNDYGIGLDILTRCKTLLAVSQEKAIDIMEMIDQINQLGIDPNIITESPNFLTVSKSEKLKPIYEVLKQYQIHLTNHNIAIAFEGSAKNIKQNLDLLIESGLYDLAQAGVNKFFTSNYKNLNMKLNLLQSQNEPLVIEKRGKRKINTKFFKTEKDLMQIYGINKKQVLEELAKVKGQDFIKNSPYYFEEEVETKEFRKEQQEVANKILEKLKQYQAKEVPVIKIGEYFYSAIKVKEQIDEIVVNFGIQDIENADVEEILKIALLKGKNITQKEVEDISEQITQLDKAQEEPKQEEQPEESPIEEPIPENLEEPKQEEQPEENIEPEIEKIGYDQIQEMTADILEKHQNLTTIKQVIQHLKDTKKSLKQQMQEMEEKINTSILENDEPTTELIQDIEKMRAIVKQQKETRKEVKQMIQKYQENKKALKKMIKKEKEERDKAMEELEI